MSSVFTARAYGATPTPLSLVQNAVSTARNLPAQRPTAADPRPPVHALRGDSPTSPDLTLADASHHADLTHNVRAHRPLSPSNALDPSGLQAHSALANRYAGRPGAPRADSGSAVRGIVSRCGRSEGQGTCLNSPYRRSTKATVRMRRSTGRSLHGQVPFSACRICPTLRGM
ncbi:hypothetical protein BV20DRAFT_467405 [Pilatotrama ljubarskyi]|nr:hypothetical protein BV20DRAFT_467405 [Pilatotrama ljubarskyi]